MLAQELSYCLDDAGAIVVGPVPTVEHALKLLRDQVPVDGAILDVNLGGVLVFPLADTLARRQVPFVFTTGYDPAGLPERFLHIPTCEKPFTTTTIMTAVAQAMHA
ncbi:response regulator [Rhizosaccharibacter radicis]|uniref:Response regulator n=1 Tax=Rhizosaccharibacter radicis TaxID=2782605 RepID=A0ABT1VV62_9PROT|nr:response regulator [Acetobacteraceae bacterium KSS12]